MITAKATKEVRSILRSLTTNPSVPNARIIIDNGKNFANQKRKADGFVRLYRDVSNPMLEQHERGIKKTLNSRLRGEVVDPEVCQGITHAYQKLQLLNQLSSTLAIEVWIILKQLIAILLEE